MHHIKTTFIFTLILFALSFYDVPPPPTYSRSAGCESNYFILFSLFNTSNTVVPTREAEPSTAPSSNLHRPILLPFFKVYLTMVAVCT